MPPFPNELHGALICSKNPNGNIIKVDWSDALKMEGVEGYVDYNDVTGSNEIGHTKDEELFASKQIKAVGQVIGMILAKTKEIAKKAANNVKINIEIPEGEKPIFTIEEAIKNKSYLGNPYVVTEGNIEEGFKKSDYIKEGEIKIGGQEHFYFETQGSIAIPEESEEMIVYASTQNPNDNHELVSSVLGVDQNKILLKCKRLGGAFGGKESRSANYSAMVAVAAKKYKKPIRLILDREVDFSITGQRHSFIGKYKVGFTKKR